MKDVKVPFSLFDFLAILLPGMVSVFAVYLWLNPQLTLEGHDAVFSTTILSGIQSEIVWFTGMLSLSYLLGHVLQELSLWLIVGPTESGKLRRLGIAPSVPGPTPIQVEQNLEPSIVNSIVREHMPRNMALADIYVATAWMFQALVLSMLLIALALIRGLLVGAITPEQVLLRLIPVAVLLPVFFSLYRRHRRMWYYTIWDAYEAWDQTRKKPETEAAEG